MSHQPLEREAGIPPCPGECTRRSLTRRWTCGSRCSPCIAGCRACTCSWRCRPLTGRVTRLSPSPWRPSGSHVDQKTGATGRIIYIHLTAQLLRSCSTTERHCIRRELFCDGQTNCVNKTDEVDCTATTQPPVNEPGLWEDPGVPFFAGFLNSVVSMSPLVVSVPFFCLLFLAVLLGYIVKHFQHKKPKHSTIRELDR